MASHAAVHEAEVLAQSREVSAMQPAGAARGEWTWKGRWPQRRVVGLFPLLEVLGRERAQIGRSLAGAQPRMGSGNRCGCILRHSLQLPS